MSKSVELMIEGCDCSVYVEGLKNIDNNNLRTHDAGHSGNRVINMTIQQIEDAVKPVISICQAVKNTTKNDEPDEIEIDMNVGLVLKGEVPIFQVFSAQSTTTVGIKVKWKK